MLLLTWWQCRPATPSFPLLAALPASPPSQPLVLHLQQIRLPQLLATPSPSDTTSRLSMSCTCPACTACLGPDAAPTAPDPSAAPSFPFHATAFCPPHDWPTDGGFDSAGRSGFSLPVPEICLGCWHCHEECPSLPVAVWNASSCLTDIQDTTHNRKMLWATLL